MKALGSDIKKFYNDKTLEYLTEHDVDDVDLESLGIDYIDDMEDSSYYNTSKLGTFIDTRTDKTVTFTKAFKDWQHKQTHTTLLIEVEKDKLNEILEFLESHSVKVIKD